MLTFGTIHRGVRLTQLTLTAWLALALFDVTRIFGFAQLHKRVHACRVREHSSSHPAVDDVVWAVDEACVWYVRHALCLQRSAVATWLLRRCGHRAELVIGYRALPFESHAWVEVDGRVVNDRPQYQKVFTVLERL